MEKSNPGIWIGSAIALAVIIVAVSIPQKPRESGPEPVPVSAKSRTSPAASPQSASADALTALKSEDDAAGTAATGQAGPKKTATRPAMSATQVPLEPSSETDLPPATREVVVQAIEDLDLVIRDFRASLGGNPVGDNAEITRALLGDNLKQIKLPISGNSHINAAGELCDMWGTPYFFHQLSGTKMEIRSAGPDRRMWTADDIRR